MALGKARQTADLLVDPRVVLHRAAAERVQPQIDRIVAARDAGEVTDDIDLRKLGEAVDVFSRAFRKQLVQRPLLDTDVRQLHTGPAGTAALEQERLAAPPDGRGFATVAHDAPSITSRSATA